MSVFKSKTDKRNDLIVSEKEAIRKHITNAISSSHTQLDTVERMAVWLYSSFLEGKDFDLEDLLIIAEEFSEVDPEIQRLAQRSSKLGALKDTDAVVFRSNLDAYIAETGINPAEFESRLLVK